MQQALADFQASLNRVRNLANDASANAATALADPALRERHETALSAVVVTLSGFFESFLRETAEEYADQINKKNYPFTQLRPEIRHAHFQGGGQLLHAIGGKKRSARHNWTTADAFDVAQRLSSVNIGTGYELVWEAFAETKGNPGPEVVREFLDRFGVDKPMETLSQNVGQTIRPLLASFIDVRNECAHTGQANQIPLPSDVLGYCDLLNRIATGIVNTLAAHQPALTLISSVPATQSTGTAGPAVGLMPSPLATTAPLSSISPSAKPSLWQRLLRFFKRG